MYIYKVWLIILCEIKVSEESFSSYTLEKKEEEKLYFCLPSKRKQHKRRKREKKEERI
jgi:hypothetical protein